MPALRSTLMRAFALVTATALAVGLLVLGSGTARADDRNSCTVQVGSTSCVVDTGNGQNRTCTIAVGDTGLLCTLRDRDHNPRGNHNPGPFPPRGGVYHGPVYRDCAEYNRNGVYDIRRGDSRYRDDWDRDRRGVVCPRGGNTTTIIDADCDDDDLSQYAIVSNSYRSSYDRYNGYLNTYRTHRTSENLRTLNRYYGDFDRNRRAYDDRRNRTTVICKDRTPPPVTYNIVQTPQQACGCNDVPAVEPAPVTAPAPRYSKVPDTSSGVNDGDGSFPLARS